jgi:hypothetical protein
MKPILRLAKPEQPIAAFPADSAAIELERPVVYLWLIIAAVSLVLALAWRFSGSAPAIPAVLNGAGLALWLTAPWLAKAWDNLLRRQFRHVHLRRERWSWRLANSGYLLLSALVLSLAPVALLLAYNLREAVAQVFLQDPLDLELRAGLWLVMSLVLAGPATVIASTILLHLLHSWWGYRYGTAGWLAATVVVNAPLVLGDPLHLTLSGRVIELRLAIGQYASWAAQAIAGTQAETRYLHELIIGLTRLPLGVLLVTLVAAILVQFPHRHVLTAKSRLWLAALAAVVAASARAVWQAWTWVNDNSRITPGDPVVLVCTGLVCAWLVWWVLVVRPAANERHLALSQLGWCLFTAGAWMCLTLPHRLTGQASMQQLLLLGVVAALVLIAGVLIMHRLMQIMGDNLTGLRYIAGAVLLLVFILPWPLAGEYISPALFGFKELYDYLITSGSWLAFLVACAALIILCALAWPYRRSYRPPAAVEQS